MTRHSFLPQAREEIGAAVAYYNGESPGLGHELARQARQLCSLIAESPLAGQEVRPGIRRRLLRRFPYAILYAVEGSDILIIAIAHQRRRPGYWRDRT